MSREHLGTSFDIHGGGADLKFPHHQNEIAQSVCCNEESYAKYWMHNGFLMVNGEKMSKSLGNFLTVEELLKSWPGEAIRLTLLSTHYRQPLDLTDETLKQSKATLDRFYRVLEGADVSSEVAVPDIVMAALNDDLNTPGALAAMHSLSGDPAALKSAGAVLGILQQDPEAWFRGEASDGEISADEVDAMIVARKEARANKDFAEADRLRDALTEAGIVIEDGAGGTTWRRA